MQFRIVDADNQVVDIGKDGEIQIKTYSRLKEYKTQEQKTRELFTEDGFLRTGSENSYGIMCLTYITYRTSTLLLSENKRKTISMLFELVLQY